MILLFILGSIFFLCFCHNLADKIFTPLFPPFEDNEIMHHETYTESNLISDFIIESVACGKGP